MNYDIIIIGSGISGLNFALRAAEKYKRVLVMTKKQAAETGTNFAQGGIAAVLSKLDDFKKHVKDTLEAGCYHNNKNAVRYTVKHGPAAIRRLIELGVPFASKDGELLLAREGGHGERRIAFVSDYTGQAIEKVLVKKVRKNPRIALLEHTFAARLLVKNHRCYGVQILQGEKFANIHAPITILTTGGCGQIFEKTTNPEISTGDGLAMADRIGCQFRDLEFIQFHPTAFSRKRKCSFLISEAVRGEGAYLRNSKGVRFMLKKHRLKELAPRDIVARAIFEEEKNGSVYLDVRHKKASFIKTRFPQIYQKLKSFGFDMTKDLIPITPAAHYLCGGVKVNLRGETGVKALYAFGEVAGTGVHGANRLASNSLLEALVFSDRILKKPIGAISKKFPKFPLPRFRTLSNSKKRTIFALKKSLQKIMWRDCGIIRTKKSLEAAKHSLQKIGYEVSKIKKSNQAALELSNMVIAAKLIIKACQDRKKSLGCHFVV